MAMAVAIEVPHGPIVERSFQVYAINSKQLDPFRDRFTVAGAKDDRCDAHVLGGWATLALLPASTRDH